MLAPVDFSPHSMAALAWAVEVARRFAAPLVVLHVVHDPAGQPGYYAEAQDGDRLERLEDAAAKMMRDFIGEARERIPALATLPDPEVMIVVGLPATRIVEVAERIGAAQIVMGSQGRSGLSRVLLGSKAQRVVQLAPMPVTIVKIPPTTGR